MTRGIRMRPPRAGLPCAALLIAAGVGGCALAGRVTPPRYRSRAELAAAAQLRQLYTLEMAYRAMNGVFASGAGQLRSVGWDDTNLRSGYYPWVVHHGKRLCVAVLPSRRGLMVASIDGRGRMWRGPYCGRPW